MAKGTTAAELRGLSRGELDRRVGELYPLYREPGAHEMAFRTGTI